jgi:hypothetical protein
MSRTSPNDCQTLILLTPRSNAAPFILPVRLSVLSALLLIFLCDFLVPASPQSPLTRVRRFSGDLGFRAPAAKAVPAPASLGRRGETSSWGHLQIGRAIAAEDQLRHLKATRPKESLQDEMIERRTTANSAMRNYTLQFSSGGCHEQKIFNASVTSLLRAQRRLRSAPVPKREASGPLSSPSD